MKYPTHFRKRNEAACIRRSIKRSVPSITRSRTYSRRYHAVQDARKLYEEGLTNPEIASRLGIKPWTAGEQVRDSFIVEKSKATYLPRKTIYDIVIAANLSYRTLCRLFAVAKFGSYDKHDNQKA